MEATRPAIELQAGIDLRPLSHPEFRKSCEMLRAYFSDERKSN